MEVATTWQDTVTAIGAGLAVAVSVTVAVVEAWRAARARNAQERAEYFATARLVTGWVEDQYVPDDSGTVYIRHAVVHIANESNDPIFRINASVGVGFETRSVGPLSVPQGIPVIPPRRTFSWDITLPLRAHENTEPPCVEVMFSDPADRRWLRGFDGSLEETTGSTGRLVDSHDEEAAKLQLGRMEDPGNPMMVVMAFLNVLSDPAEDIDLDKLRRTLAPEAAGWKNLTMATAQKLREDLKDYGLGTFVAYPAPHVAYVKILREHAAAGSQVVSGEGVVVHSLFLTLTYVYDRGWRVFAYGSPIEPDRIKFPRKSLFRL